jgi:hypothetical protein
MESIDTKNDTTIKNVKQRIEHIALSEIAPAAYQRSTNQKQIKNIIANFDSAKLGMPIVSARGGKFYLLDGLHRISAMRKLNFTQATFIVLDGLTYEQEAEYFRSQNDNSRPLTKYNLFKAGLEAKNEMCCRIVEIANKNGFTIGTSSKKFNVISAIYAVETVTKIYGYDVLDKTLSLIRETWDGQKSATFREFIVGVAEFISRFGKVEFAEKMKRKNLALIWQDFLASSLHTERKTNNPAMRRAFCYVLVNHYNSGIPARSKQRLQMEN